jgi:AcrR family transcriptional regulator
VANLGGNNTKKNSKPPEIRRQELIDTAARLFEERGYEGVSVRDILDAVGGQPGMFYYYFRSKQEIYIATMEDYVSKRLEHKCELLEDESKSFDEKLIVFRELVSGDIAGYMKRFAPKDKNSISDSAYKLWDMSQMLDRMAKPYSKLILQGIAEGRLSDRLGITEENAEMYALFALYGFWGAVYNGRFTQGSSFEPAEVFKISNEFFGK